MRYISDKIISFSILINGTYKRVRFIPKMQGGSIYVTNHQSEIKALEDSDMYNRVYTRAPDCKDEELPKNAGTKGNANPDKAAKIALPKADKAAKAASPKIKVVKTVSTWQEAVEYLSTKCGSEAEKLTTPEAIANEAVEKGVSFVNLK